MTVPRWLFYTLCLLSGIGIGHLVIYTVSTLALQTR